MIPTVFSLKGKKILVTGASSGIGYAICKAIDTAEGSFIAVARREEKLQQLLTECTGTNHSFLRADLSIDTDLQQLVADISQIDGIVHAAGVARFVPLKFYSIADFHELQRINVDSILYILNHICKKKKLNKNASVVLISSLAAYLGTIGGAYYSASKAQLISLARVWSNELAASGSRVNCLAPGIVKTELVEDAFGRLSKEEIAIDEKKYPLGYGTPEDIANPVIFLLSNASRWITGQSIIIDGGRSNYV
ncbi:MAG: SDR family oxidoreductase [Flavipsychrobacter sp.]|nr:SDR family oxidoreductase [Flavipsychrobacter sp.]